LNEYIEEFDKLKTKVLKYILYKKRTEKEVWQKFSALTDEKLLEDVIQELKDIGYINDENYIKRAVDEFLAINTLSIKEMKNKLFMKGLNSDLIDNYFSENDEKLHSYEINCAKKIIIKKSAAMETEEIIAYLYKKGYTSENVRQAFEEI